MTYPSSGTRRLNIPTAYEDIVRAFAHENSAESLAQSVLANVDLKTAILCETIKTISREITGLASQRNPSVLRYGGSESLKSFTWGSLQRELSEKAPTLWTFLEKVTVNPNSTGNKYKKISAKIPALCSVAAKLANIFTKDLNVVRKINSVILKNGHTRKSAYARLSQTYDCMSYVTTQRLMDDIGQDYDNSVFVWQERYVVSLIFIQYSHNVYLISTKHKFADSHADFI